MQDYEQQFQAALTRTREFGLSPIRFEPSPSRYLTKTAMAGLRDALLEALDNPTSEDIFGQCLAIHCKLMEPLAEYFGAPTYLTIGWVSVKGGSYFEVDESTLRGWLATGIDRPDLKLHAWLTLPSHEILDFTLPTTISIAEGRPENAGGALTKHPTDLIGNVKYHPMIVGTEYLQRIGAMVFVLHLA